MAPISAAGEHERGRLAGATAMNGHALPAGTPAHPRGWHEFCELHAISTAKELARHYLRFATEHPHHDLLAAENFSVQFTDLFQQYFCHEVKEGFALNQLRILPTGPARDYRETHRRHTDASLGTVVTKAEVEPSARPEQPGRAPEATSTGLRKSWSSEELAGPARRPFSLSQLRRSWRSLFRRRSSDALPGDGEVAAEAALKPGLSKRILPWGLSWEQPPEVRKEGVLKYGLLDETFLDSGTRWQRCRLVLRRVGTPDGEEYVLELFDPPKGHHERGTHCPQALANPKGNGCPARRSLPVMGNISVSRHHPGPGKSTFVSIWIPFGVLHPARWSGLDHVCSCPHPCGSPRGKLARAACYFLSVVIKKLNNPRLAGVAALILQPRATLLHRPLVAGQHMAGELHPSPGISRDHIPLLASPGATSLSWHPSPRIPRDCILLLASPGQEPGNLPRGLQAEAACRLLCHPGGAEVHTPRDAR
ncbi:SH2B adapter protein 3 isoform X2 [Harpia harpyja]|uniref:SH2B adapter protein 3 isoform X2 n=1 Tax=Harpia harpyja TaxID=202280 RepID=UPI0022B18C00|nr:SH2B adapter protein 3 isoform X2 [Harpia harpyja]